jgi:hypothetical protein
VSAEDQPFIKTDLQINFHNRLFGGGVRERQQREERKSNTSKEREIESSGGSKPRWLPIGSAQLRALLHGKISPAVSE